MALGMDHLDAADQLVPVAADHYRARLGYQELALVTLRAVVI